MLRAQHDIKTDARRGRKYDCFHRLSLKTSLYVRSSIFPVAPYFKKRYGSDEVSFKLPQMILASLLVPMLSKYFVELTRRYRIKSDTKKPGNVRAEAMISPVTLSLLTHLRTHKFRAMFMGYAFQVSHCPANF